MATTTVVRILGAFLPMTTNGQRGADFERSVRKALVDVGYVVIRSTASKTGVDLVALWNGPGDPEWTTDGTGLWLLPALLVQAKTDGRLDPGEWNVLYDLGSASETRAMLVCREQAGRRKVPAFYALVGRKITGQRNPPKVRVYPPERRTADAE